MSEQQILLEAQARQRQTYTVTSMWRSLDYYISQVRSELDRWGFLLNTFAN